MGSKGIKVSLDAERAELAREEKRREEKNGSEDPPLQELL